jgi:hypothetical protein
MKELLITKHAVAYAAAKSTPTTIDTATTPDLLAEGSVGIYYTSNSTKLPALVIGTGIAAINVAEAAIVTEVALSKVKFFVAIGTATGADVKYGFSAEQVISALSREYADPVKQQWYVGYDGSTASKDFNLTSGNKTALMNYDSAGVKVDYRGAALGTTEDDYKYFNASLSAGDTEWEIASKLADAVNRQTTAVNKLVAEVSVPTYTGAVGALTAANFTKGSNVFTVTAAGDLAVGDYITLTMNPLTNLIVTGTAPTGLTGATYKIIAVASTTTFTIDRNYSGETQTIAAFTGFVRTTSAPATIGVRLISAVVGTNFDVSSTGVLGLSRDSTDANRNYSGADLTLVVGGNLGSGTPAQVAKLEKDVFIEHGQYAYQDGLMRRAVSKVVTPAVISGNSLGGYDLYFIKYRPTGPSDSTDSDLIFAFEEVAASGIASVTEGLLNSIFGTGTAGKTVTTNSVKDKANTGA